MTTTRQLRIIAALAVAVLGAAVLAPSSPASAAARPVAAPGVAIYTRNGSETLGCTLSFTARDNRGDRLAVTAGHCATGLRQEVFLDTGASIGTVLAWRPDTIPTRDFGYTVIWLYDDVTQSAAIDADTALDTSADGNTGDLVCMFGAKSGRTCGAIQRSAPGLMTTYTNIATHGDSGAPVLRVTDRAVIGIVIGGDHNGDRSETLIEPLSRITEQVTTFPAFAGFGPVVVNP